jgi:hypothetical protein
MNRILMLATFAGVLAFSGAATCNKTNPTEPTNPVVAGVIDCAEEGVHNVAITSSTTSRRRSRPAITSPAWSRWSSSSARAPSTAPSARWG